MKNKLVSYKSIYSKTVDKILNKVSNVSQNKNYNLFDSSFAEQNNEVSIFFIVALVTAVIKSDDQPNFAEKNSCIEEMQKRGFDANNIQEIYNLALEDTEKYQLYIRKIKLQNSYNKRFFIEILQIAIIVAAADAPINVPEMSILEDIANQLNISNEDFDQIFFSSLLPSEGHNAYSVLGTTIYASMLEIEKLYKSLVKIYHPDNYCFDDFIADKYKKVIEAKFKLIQKSYEKIKSQKNYF